MISRSEGFEDNTFALRPLTEQDADAYFDLVRRCDTASEHYNDSKSHWQDHPEISAEGIFIAGNLEGAVMLRPSRFDSSAAVIGYLLSPGYREKRIMTAALNQFLLKMHGQRGIKKFKAYVLPDNHASIGVLTHNGFSDSGFTHTLSHGRKYTVYTRDAT